METFPETVCTSAAAAGLGAVRSRYRPEIELLRFYASGLSLFAPVFLTVCLFRGDPVDLVIGLGAIPLSLLSWCEVSRRAKRWLYLCEHGILLPHHRRSRRGSFRWEEVAHLWTSDTTWVDPTIGIFPTHGCVVELTDDDRINLGEMYGDDMYGEADLLSNKVEAIITKVLHRRRLEQLRTKGHVDFGPITVQPTGLTAGSTIVGWDGIAVIEVAPTRLRARDRDNRVIISQRIKRIPDLDVLLRIVADHGVTSRRVIEGEDGIR